MKRNLSGLILSLIISVTAIFMLTNCTHNDQFTVCIDAGHGGYDNGTKSPTSILEKDINLKVALKLGKILEKNNIKVVYTRTNDKVPWPSNQKSSLKERCYISNKAKADLFISIHCNYDEFSSITRGPETWCRFSETPEENLAKNIQNELVNLKYSHNRGLKYEKNGGLYVLRHTKAVSALVELGFLSNSKDTKFLITNKAQEKCAQAIARGILNFKNYKS
ncbi:N-acetylmuramoyl-L-alanine amidase family protein [Clostridium ganghwense]|uniref:N-acetylmuramoyl-L-alanine amidase n=1 Tax=Clostridium ganghwense TaxID=312089 RepID=A0ABT4CPQ8_9CLOT|nr:N-acetylmuramoyl-L-alanine amidase [Clostridium ganghwense]MCY6371048.1 N-acetylmuramoyl-L-alanine amidase [Clostridium ganghwense]